MYEDNPSSESDGPISPENFKKVQLKFADAVARNGIDSAVIQVLINKIYVGMEYVYEAKSRRSNFYDIGLIEYGQPDGRYQIVIDEYNVSSRAERLSGYVPEERKKEIAYSWLVSHELGHALQSAYGLAHESVYETGEFEGLSYFPGPDEDYLAAHPDQARYTDSQEARRYEREIEAEGFARLVLLEELTSLGIEADRATQITSEIYQTRREQLESTILAEIFNSEYEIHEIGYTNPLTKEELALRFNK